MAQERNNVYIWTTWLAKIMAGESTCDFQAWFKAHYTYDKLPSDFDVAKWTMDHTRSLRQLRSERASNGDRVCLENENSFKYEFSSGVWVAGKPDLVAIASDRHTVYDVKTGQPKTSDQIQVMLYMYLLPLTTPAYRGISFDGCVVYPTNRKIIPAGTIDSSFIANFEYFVNSLATNARPIKSPSDNECRFCDIGNADCSERIDTIFTPK